MAPLVSYRLLGGLTATCLILLLAASPAAAQTGATDPQLTGSAASSARLWQDGDPGQRLHLRGRVVSTDGEPVVAAEIMLWQADGAGSYHENRYRAQLFTTGGGEFRLTTAVPGSYYGLKHIHVMVSHPNHQPLMTRVLFRGDPQLGPEDEDQAILLEEVRSDGATVMVGNVQFVLEPL